MAANLEEVVVTARTFPNILSLPVAAKFGDLEIQTTVESVHTDTLHVTEHPVESGAAITDHSYKRPAEVTLRCGWSNASLKADYVSGIYSQLLKLQESRDPISITTPLRQYDSMLITSLQVTRDQKTGFMLMVTATCREVLIVSTSSATLAPKESQADPASTAEVEDVGAQQATAGTPAPGGSVPPNEW
jgi:hypothetical protein